MNSIKTEIFKVQWTEIRDMPYVFTPMADYTYEREEYLRKYDLTVYVQKKEQPLVEIESIINELVFLTVHDVGSNPPNSFIEFVNSPTMVEFLKDKSAATFLHVCVPGQEVGAKEFVKNFVVPDQLCSKYCFPTMDELSQLLPQVLDHFGIKCCIAMGEGAGADVVYRFACTNPEMVSGVMLIHCTSSTHGFVQNLKEMIANLRIEEGKMSESAWDYLIAHKLDQKPTAESKERFIEGIRQIGLNEHNLSQYLHAFANRDELEIFNPSKFHSILVTGGLSPYNKNIFHMFEQMDKTKTGLIVGEGVSDILNEAPKYLTLALSNLLKDRKLEENDGIRTIEMAKNKDNNAQISNELQAGNVPMTTQMRDSSIQASKFQCSHCGYAISAFKMKCHYCEESHGQIAKSKKQ